MQLIHKRDANNNFYNELYDKDKLIRKVKVDKEPAYQLFQKVYLGGSLHIVKEIVWNVNDEILLTVEFEDFEDYLDKIYVTKDESGEYRTLKEQKEMKASEFAMKYFDIDLMPYQVELMDNIDISELAEGLMKAIKAHNPIELSKQMVSEEDYIKVFNHLNDKRELK